jgi:hypothetical protein
MSNNDEHTNIASPVRIEVAKKYCKVMILIDDEIYRDRERPVVNDRFKIIQRECEQKGILCHLYQYESRPFDSDDQDVMSQIDQAVDLSKTADIIVIDWYLYRSDPQHTIKVIQELQEHNSIHFVVIYTQETHLNNIATELKKKIIGLKDLQNSETGFLNEADDLEEDELELVPPDEVDPNDEANEVNLHLMNKLFIFIRSQTHPVPGHLIDEIYRTFHCAFPDHLQWAALEMAVRNREMMPRVMGALPEDTNSPVYHQLLYQRDGEIAEAITEILLDELRFGFGEKPLGTVSDDEMFIHLRQKMNNTLSDIADRRRIVSQINPTLITKVDAALRRRERGEPSTADDESANNRFLELAERWSTTNLDGLRGSMEKESLIKDYFPFQDKVNERKFNTWIAAAFYLHGGADDDSLVKNHKVWASIRESVLLPPMNRALQTGYILRRKNMGKKAEWLLCITPGCDCYRPTGKGYLFITGTTDTEIGAKSEKLSETRLCVKEDEIIWDASCLVWERGSETCGLTSSENGVYVISGVQYVVQGALRYPFLMRLIQRVWSYQSRVAVDTSEFLRKRREG